MKRANGAGSVSQLPNGRWWARISLPRGQRKAFYGDTRAAVEKQLRAALVDRDRGKNVPTGRLTVGGWLDQWLKEHVQGQREPSTYTSYEVAVRLHLKPALGTKRLADLTPSQVRAWVAAEIERGAKRSSVHKWLLTLRTALHCAVREELLTRNVASLARVADVGKKTIPAAAYTEGPAILEAVKGDRLEALYVLALALGLRLGECCALNWADMDFPGRILTARRSLQRIAGGWRIKLPKTPAGVRKLPMPSLVMEALTAHRARQNAERLRAGEVWPTDGPAVGLVFTNELGQPVYHCYARDRLARLLAAAGIERVTPHDLRHGCVSTLLMAGVPLATVSTIAGHRQLATTKEIYGHLTPESLRGALDVMDTALRSAPVGMPIGITDPEQQPIAANSCEEVG